MFTIEVTDVDTGELVCTIASDGSAVTETPEMGLVDETWTPDEVLAQYDGWSNGYVQARKVEDE